MNRGFSKIRNEYFLGNLIEVSRDRKFLRHIVRKVTEREGLIIVDTSANVTHSSSLDLKRSVVSESSAYFELLLRG